jgi:surface polysaccharide O-acyltransferase-like enzyme
MKDPSSPKTHAGVECFRFVGIFLVIIGHCRFFLRHADPFSYVMQGVFLDHKWVMPFFFIISGYFWGRKIEKSDQPVATVSSRYAGHLLKLWLLWNVIYLVVPGDVELLSRYGAAALIKVPYWRLLDLFQDPWRLLFVGASKHLWFVMSLVWAVGLTALGLKLEREKLLMGTGLAAFSFGVLAGPWSVTPIGVALGFYTRNGPFLGLIFFIIGWRMSRAELSSLTKYRWPVFLCGTLMLLVETYVLRHYFGVDTRRYAFLLSSLPYGVGVTLFVLSWPSLGRNSKVSRLASYTLGVYLIHLVFVDLLNPINSLDRSHFWDFVFPVLVYALSVGAVRLMGKTKSLRLFVS